MVPLGPLAPIGPTGSDGPEEDDFNNAVIIISTDDEETMVPLAHSSLSPPEPLLSYLAPLALLAPFGPPWF